MTHLQQIRYMHPEPPDNIDEQAWIEELIALTQNEIIAYRTFLNELKAQQSALIDRDILRLTKCNQTAEGVMAKARDCSLRRNAKLLEGAAHFRSSKELQSLEQVIPIVSEQYAERLRELRGALQAILKKIRASNGATLYLLQNSIGCVNDQLQLIYQEMNKSGGYGIDGAVPSRKRLSTVLEVA